MGNLTAELLLDHLYNKKLPKLYQEEDSKLGYPLKRYLESLITGGFCGSIDDIEGMMHLIDPENIPEEYIPYLYESLGIKHFPDIDAVYHRKFLLNIGEIIKRRGTFSCVHYIIRVLTGLESELSVANRTLYVGILTQNLSEFYDIDTSISVIKSFLKTHIPYYIDIVIIPRVATQVIQSKSYSFSAIREEKTYTISKP